MLKEFFGIKIGVLQDITDGLSFVVVHADSSSGWVGQCRITVSRPG